MANKITVQQLYIMARQQEIAEYDEAVKVLAETCGGYMYDEDSHKQIDNMHPVVAANPKHASLGDFEVIGIDKDGYLTLKDEWGNVLENESKCFIEYAHLQYVTDFIYWVICDALEQKVISLMEKKNLLRVNVRVIATYTWYDKFNMKHIDQVLTSYVFHEGGQLFIKIDDNTPIVAKNFSREDKIKIYNKVINQLKNEQ